ncbi:aflatoxin efflux pump aflt [Curvularia clavata]|uniref:Aflatoxin efflux pump aflt n=1 Tax=Curvularia clavata TaxID=95742 RepID=A0A9Q8YZ96_CURCL|nr:aflatoxin efflux pump aflt [Curvularia clavata]
MERTPTPSSASHTEPEKPTKSQASTSNDYADTEENFNPKSVKFWLIIISIYMCFFLVALDRMIIATAIPAITNTFDSIADIGWYGSAYMLACAIFGPFFGKLYQIYNTKWTFLISIIIFEVGSVVCGAAPSSTACENDCPKFTVVYWLTTSSVIIGRTIAGAGAAGISNGAIMVTVSLVPLRKRPVFTGLFGLAFGVSSVLGPFLGGTFTDSRSLGWRWCFYINLPIGAFTFVAVLFFLRIKAPPKTTLSIFAQIKRLDPIGLLFFAPSMVCLILALQWGGTTDPWSAPKIIGLFVAFAVTFIAFLIVEFKMPETAMAPRRVVCNRSMAGAMLFAFIISGSMMNVFYYISIWFQAAQGQSAMQGGVRTIPMVVSLVLTGIINGAITQKIGYYNPSMFMTPILTSVAAGLLSMLTPHSGSNEWIGYQIFFGIGLGFGLQSTNLVAQTVLPQRDVSLGIANIMFMQQQGGAIFLAVGQNIFSQQLVKQLSGIADLNTQAVINTGATDLRKIVPVNEIDTVIDAYSYSLTRVFILSAALSAFVIIATFMVEWRSIKKGAGPSTKENKDLEKDAETEKEAEGDK